MIVRALLLTALAAPVAGLSQPPPKCPWLNSGTAAQVLGSAVTATAQLDADENGACRFVSNAHPDRLIEIDVGSKMKVPWSGSGISLTGIGNQAVFSAVREPHGVIDQYVAGRVRNAFFLVRLAGEPDDSPVAQRSTVPSEQSPIVFLAEQVAGNLY